MWGRATAATALAATFVAATAAGASAGGLPGPGAVRGAEGVTVGPDGTRYQAIGVGARTRIEKQQARTGTVLARRTFVGAWGVPLVSYDGRTEGVSPDGSRLLLGDVSTGARPRAQSAFLVLSTRSLRVQRRITLRGDFAYDAVSPDFRTLYLVEYKNGLHYVVRALDLASGRLRPGVIADKRSYEWLMQGIPITRAASRDGAWAYTLYGGGEHVFVHALDTRHRAAVCIDLPWRGMPQTLWQLRLALDGPRLVLRRPDGRAAAVIDTGSFRVLSALRSP